MRILISILSILAIFSFAPRNVFSAGQACCGQGYYTGLVGTSLDPNLCCNAIANICIATACSSTEGCTNNICDPNVTPPPPCTAHQQCYSSPTSYSGCSWNGQYSLCTLIPYPTIPPTTPTAAPGGPGNVSFRCTTANSINPNDGIQTAVGCISTDWQTGGFIGSILALAVGVGGGFALLLMLYGTFIITTSAGIPDKLKAGKEIITSAIIGLIFMIFSIVLMELIGVSILGIPGL